ncbi:MAG: ssDNA-binding protein [Pseudomonadota bacterium]
MTPVGVLNFPVLFEPKGNQQNPQQDPRFSGMLLFDSVGVATTAYADLSQEIMQAVRDKWHSKADDENFIKRLRFPIRAASEKDYEGFEDGEKFISAWCKGTDAPPGVVDLDRQPLGKADVWAGQQARFSVRPFAYDSNGNMGVALGLNHVQIVNQDMPRLDGRQSADKAFGDADNSQLVQMGIGTSAPATGGGAGKLPF